ncbi:MAG: hypothetical protein Q8O01_01975, partial [Candidatus Omnitrophota bacterium]|nr:hypothetical protein [Candidatus Omnitrophota bacterium]
YVSIKKYVYVIPAEAGIYDGDFILYGFPIKAFGNDSFSCSVGALLYAKLLPIISHKGKKGHPFLHKKGRVRTHTLPLKIVVAQRFKNFIMS